jgi:proton-coupled amino acid transporter
MLFPALKILEKSVTPRFLRPRVTRWRKNWFRSFVVAVTLLVSYVGSTQLNNFVALVGCFCCTPLAFIYPCWFHLKLVKAGWVSKAIDVAIIIFGIAVFVFSTYQAIDTWSVSDISPCTSR